MLRSRTDRAPSAPTTGRPPGWSSPSCTSTDAWSQYKCSCGILSPSNCTTTTIAISTRFPVGGMPGSIQSIEIEWVNRKIISLTRPALAYCPGHREHLRIRRDLIQEVLLVKLVYLFSAIATDHHRHLVDQRVRRHGDDGLIGALRGKLGAQMLVPYVVKLLLSGR